MELVSVLLALWFQLAGPALLCLSVLAVFPADPVLLQLSPAAVVSSVTSSEAFVSSVAGSSFWSAAVVSSVLPSSGTVSFQEVFQLLLFLLLSLLLQFSGICSTSEAFSVSSAFGASASGF